MMAHVKPVVVSRGEAPSCTAVPVVALGGVAELFNLVEAGRPLLQRAVAPAVANSLQVKSELRQPVN
jgi:hypothetical protein